MNPMLTLVQREWLQYRRSWLLLALIPLVLAVLLLGVGHIEIDADEEVPPAIAFAAIAVAVTGTLMLLLFLTAGLITVIGLARRDHGDRSVEFWLSLPVSHPRALAVPMVVHLGVLPLLGAMLGVLAGFGLAALLVSRVHGAGELAAVPWGALAQGAAVGVTRLAVGWPMALLWVSPVLIAAMLAFAWARRWGPFALGAVVVLAQTPLAGWLGLAWLKPALHALFSGALTSLVSGQGVRLRKGEHDDTAAVLVEGLARAPAWLAQDVWASVQQLASPVLLAALVVSALGFAALVQWRRRGASAAL